MAKILLVEDDSLIVKIYSTRLKADGFTVVSADNGEDGLALAFKEIPDFILLDVMMPKMDGFNVLQQLRANPALSNTPIIVYSNLAQESEMQKANISPTELVGKIKSYLNV